MTRVRVALADDHPVVLAGIKALLQAAPEVALVGEATTGMAALQLIVETSPDVAVIDISLPDLNGLELARRLAEACPGVRLLALTVHEDRAYVQPLLQAGARGYLLKRSAAEDLVRAIRAVAAGGVYLDPAVADKALPEPELRGSAPPDAEPLSQREQEVLRLTPRGSATRKSPRGSMSAAKRSKPTRPEARTRWGCGRAPISCAMPSRVAGSMNSGHHDAAGPPRGKFGGMWRAVGRARARLSAALTASRAGDSRHR